MFVNILWRLVLLFFTETATTEIYTYCHTLSLRDALPILARQHSVDGRERADNGAVLAVGTDREDDGLGTQVHGFGIAEPRRSAISGGAGGGPAPRDRKSTRLNSSH